MKNNNNKSSAVAKMGTRCCTTQTVYGGCWSVFQRKIKREAYTCGHKSHNC